MRETMRGAARGVVDAVRWSRPVRAVREWREAGLFSRWPGRFHGVFETFAQAAAAAPRGARLGYDSPEMAGMYREHLERVFENDYPVLLWLSRSFEEGARSVFDYGGHTGLKFFSFAKYLRYPDGLRWVVCEVPAVVSDGRRLAQMRGAPGGLAFTIIPEDGNGHDILLASGSLQYVEEPVAVRLARLQSPPRHLLLNKIAAYSGPAYVTLQNTMHAYNPYCVYNRGELLNSLYQLGYALVDEWEDLEHSVRMPLNPDREVPHYSGYYLRRV